MNTVAVEDAALSRTTAAGVSKVDASLRLRTSIAPLPEKLGSVSVAVLDGNTRRRRARLWRRRCR